MHVVRAVSEVAGPVGQGTALGPGGRRSSEGSDHDRRRELEEGSLFHGRLEWTPSLNPELGRVEMGSAPVSPVAGGIEWAAGMLNPDRYFDPNPAVRDVARGCTSASRTCRSSARTGTSIRGCSPRTRRSPIRRALLVIPDHYVMRMLYSQGVPLERLGVPSRDGTPVETDPAHDLAALRRSLPPVSRHAERLLAGARARGRVRYRRARSRRRAPTAIYDRIEAQLADTGVPAARALRALQHRGALHDRRRDRPADVAPADPRVGLEGAAFGRRSAPIWPSTSCIPTGARRSSASATLVGQRGPSYARYIAALEDGARSSSRWARRRRTTRR